MPKDIADRRVQKTRKLLQDALVSLITEKSFDSITIQEILDRANVGRSTFYFHYGNKYELLHSCFEDFCDLFEKHNECVSNNGRSSGNSNEPDFILSLFRFVGQNHQLYKAVLGMEGMGLISNPIHQYIFSYINNSVKKSVAVKAKTPLELDMLAHYTTSAFIGTMFWWINNDMPCTVEDVTKNFKRFATYDVGELL